MSDYPDAPSKAETNYRLVVFHGVEQIDPVRDLICRVTSLHPTDAMQWIARMPGIVRHPLTQAETRGLLDGLFELGIAAEAWRVDALPVLTPLRTIHKAACLDEGLRILGLRGEPTHWVPWDRVELIAAGLIEQPDELRDVAAPNWVQAVSMGFNAILRRPQMIARRRRMMKITREPYGEAIIVRRDPRIAFRVIQGQMNYEYLGEWLRSSASENFPLFLEDLRQRSFAAYVSPATETMLSGGPEELFSFPTSDALLEDAILRLLWGWYRRDREKGHPTEMG